ncbi:MAG: hypothetical protein P8I91_03765 [Phycisphaerales bacterium]|nr:hypothetical protein [Phycisphaerales bacterium]
MDISTKAFTVAMTACIGVSSLAVAGPVFDEPPGGAGTSRDDATDVKTENGGQVGMITGSLTGTSGFVGGGSDYQDVYRIYIADPGVFRADTMMLDGADSLRDPMLFLFNEEGHAIIANNNIGNDQPQSGLVNDDGNGSAFFTQPGIYYLAITSAVSEATAMIANETVPLFEMGLSENQTGIIQPRSSWSQIPWTGWTQPTDYENFGHYEIALQGVVSLPAPGGLALLGLAVIGRRRRRH